MRVQVEPSELLLVPGQTTTLQVIVYNPSQVIEGYRAELVGLDSPVPMRAEPELLSLFPDSEGEIELTFEPPADFPAGEYEAALEVRATTVGDQVVTIPVRTQVDAVATATLAIEPQSVTGGRSGRLGLVAENHGNVPVTLDLRGEDPEAAVDFDFAHPELEVLPGRRRTSHVRVRARRPFLGTPIARILNVRAAVRADVATAERIHPLETVGSFVQKPLVPRALLTLLAILLALGLWGAVLYSGINEAATEVASEVNGAGTSSIVGTVTDGSNGIGGVAIEAAGESGAASATTLTAGQVGAFTLKGLVGGETYVLTFTADGFSPLTYEVPVPDGNGAVVSTGTIVLGRGASGVSGTVTDADGEPLGEVSVTVTKAGASEATARAVTANGGTVGFYSISGLGAGDYTVTFERFGFTSAVRELTLEPGASAELPAELAAEATASIEGSVSADVLRVIPCGAGECPLSGATVTASSEAGDRSATTLSSPQEQAGRYSLTNLPAGTYTVTFAREGYESQVIEVELGVGQQLSASVQLRGRPGSVSGSATGCTKVEARKRDLSRVDGNPTTQPGADGSYTLAELRTPGEYRLLFSGPQLKTVDVNLGPGEARPINVSCEKPPPPPTTSTTTSSENPEGEGAETPIPLG